MKNRHIFQNQTFLVLGLAKSGYAAAKLLLNLGAKVVVNDQAALEKDRLANELKQLGAVVIGGGHPVDLLEKDSFAAVVKNPGIPYDNPIVMNAEEKGIPVVTEVEISGLISEADIIAITGTNGKTTTTSLIGEILKESDRKIKVAGNIGTALCEVCAESEEDETVVAELSSFQLAGTIQFHPRVAVFLNLYEAHLDYHGSMANYARAKAKIFANQTAQDILVYNADDSFVSKLAEKAASRKIPFSLKKFLSSGVCLCDQTVYFREDPIIKTEEIALVGRHNLENVLASVGAALASGASKEAVRAVLRRFNGVRHRLQYVATIEGRSFYNDSKATNPLATKKAIEAFSAPVVLLCGGLDRGISFDTLQESFRSLKAVVTFGETAKKMAKTAQQAGIKSIHRVDNVEEAVPLAFRLSAPGDVILLSPACASWDQYRTFEERGDMFINSVHKLKVTNGMN